LDFRKTVGKTIDDFHVVSRLLVQYSQRNDFIVDAK